MRVLLAFDKFRDALTAPAACAAAADALHARHPDWELDLCPLTDGGEGFVEILTPAGGGTIESVAVTGPRGHPVTAPLGLVSAARLPAAVSRFGLLPPAEPRARQKPEIDSFLAVTALAPASGLALLPAAERDPWLASTTGVGELFGMAAERGATAILLGLGGSATNDLGLGALEALGFRFLDAAGAVVPRPVPAVWEKIVRIELPAALRLPPLFLACDVTNPLLGPEGATATFGPQKGLRPDDVSRLEMQMARMAALLCEASGKPHALANTPGAGAAGGIAFGLMAGCGARLLTGSDLVSAWLDLPARLAAADLVLTGEGRFDATSLGGKGPGALIAAAQAAGKPVHIFAGSLGVPADATTHAITPSGMPLAEALARTAELLEAAVGRTF
ncbi:MAG: glycerate kinase [Opitutales bacterium]